MSDAAEATEAGRPGGAPLMIVEVDVDLMVVGWNRRAARTLQISREAALGRPLAELLPVDGGAATWRSVLARGDESPQLVATDHPRLGRRHLELWAQPAEHGAPATIYAHDVTDRVARERQLEIESTVLAAVEANLDIATWALDRSGVYLHQRGKGTQTAGLEPDQLLGRNLFDIYGREGMREVLGAIAGERHHTPPAEAHGFVMENWFVPADRPGEVAMVGITLDVSEAKRREDELRTRLDLIERQRETIRELSTPIIEVWDGVLALPVVGIVDSVRTAEIMDSLLQTVTRTRSRFAILDLTGVQVVDTHTASHLIGLIQAVRLLGAEGVMTGIHPNIAQTIVAIGVDLARVRVFARLRDALEYCVAQLRARR